MRTIKEQIISFDFIPDVAESLEYGLKDALFTACKVGDVTALGRLLQSPEGRTESFEELRGEASTIPSPLSLLNKPVDSSGFTLLHVAAAAAQKEAVRLLLDSGADPACRYKDLYSNTANYLGISFLNINLVTGIIEARPPTSCPPTRTLETSFVNTWARIPTSMTTERPR